MLRLDDLLAERIDHRFKGFPAVERTVGDVGAAGWNLLAGDLLMPMMTLRRSALEHNQALMSRWCAEHGASLAPHGKTTMAPQLFDRQLAAGAWGITAANVSHARVMRAYGVDRIVIANEVTGTAALRWLFAELDRGLEVLCYVDSAAGLERITAARAEAGAAAVLPVLVELGQAGGRAGVRADGAALDLAALVAASPAVRLAGVAAYEGLQATDREPATMAPVDELLDRLTGFVTAADQRGLFGGDEVVLTAGGSAYFDRVVARAAELGEVSRPVRVLLRSGCYLTHDHGSYERTSPLRSGAAGPTLRPALELWAEVLSVPEPGLAIAGFGKRDAPFDIEFPMPLDLHRDGAREDLTGRAEVVKLNDQHAFLGYDAGPAPRPGDLIRFGLSHPCTAFDKWPLIAEVDDDHCVVGAIRTLF